MITVVTRAIYNTLDYEQDRSGDPWKEGWVLTPDRVRLFENNYIRALNSQIDQDFQVCIIHGEELGPLPMILEHLKQKVIYVDSFKGIPRTEIQARLDTDDWAAPGWTAHMRHLAGKRSEKRFLIHYEPFLQREDGMLAYHPRYHFKKIASCFLALVQKGVNKKKRIHIHSVDHPKMPRKVGKCVWVPPGYSFLVMHGDNKSSSRHSTKHTL